MAGLGRASRPAGQPRKISFSTAIKSTTASTRRRAGVPRVGQDRDASGLVDPCPVRELVEPADEDLVGIGKALPRRERGPSVDHHGAQAEGVREADGTDGDLACPNDHEAARRLGHLEIHLERAHSKDATAAIPDRGPCKGHEGGVGLQMAE